MKAFENLLFIHYNKTLKTMPKLLRTTAQLLLLTLLVPVVQAHTDHNVQNSGTQNLLYVVMHENRDNHREAIPHNDTTTSSQACDDHPTEVEIVASFKNEFVSQSESTTSLTNKVVSTPITKHATVFSYRELQENSVTNNHHLLVLRN